MLFGAIFGFTTSAGSLYHAHWIGLAFTALGLSFTAISLSWGAETRRGYGPSVLVATAAPLLLTNPMVSLLEDFAITHRQLFFLKEQVVLLTAIGETALLMVRCDRGAVTCANYSLMAAAAAAVYCQAIIWNSSWDKKLISCYWKLAQCWASSACTNTVSDSADESGALEPMAS